MIASATTFPALSSTATTTVALCTSIPIYFGGFIGRSFDGLALVFDDAATLPLFERSFFITGVHSTCLVKQSQALRGRNLTRDNQAEGASIVHQAADNEICQRPSLFSLSIEHRS